MNAVQVNLTDSSTVQVNLYIIITTLPESFQLRPVSPSLQYTTVKDGSGFPTSTGSLLATPTWVLPDEDSATPILDLQASLPISPASMSYKVGCRQLELSLVA